MSSAPLEPLTSRRRFLAGIGIALSPLGSPASAQETRADKVPRIGAKALGLTVPRFVVARADEVIQ